MAGIALAVFCNRGLWRQIGTRIVVFPDGIEHIRRGESIRYRWEDIQAYYGSGLCRDAILYVEIDWHYRVIHRAGNQFEFSEQFQSKEETPIGYLWGYCVWSSVCGAGLVWAWWTDLSFADRRISIGGAVFGAALLYFQSSVCPSLHSVCFGERT